jgi:hypothetical protein
MDLKPYVPAFDYHPAAKIGWLTAKLANKSLTRVDPRFST